MFVVLLMRIPSELGRLIARKQAIIEVALISCIFIRLQVRQKEYFLLIIYYILREVFTLMMYSIIKYNALYNDTISKVLVK